MNRNCEAIGREGTSGGDTVLIPMRVDLSETIVEISSSGFASGAITSPRTLIVCWGENFMGCLGRKTMSEAFDGPGKMTGLIQEVFRVESLSFGRYHGMALTISSKHSEGRKLWIWGYNSDFQLGNGVSDNISDEVASEVPFFATRNLTIEKIESGGYCSACITVRGALYMWGTLSEFCKMRTPILVSFGEGRSRCLNISLSDDLALFVCEKVRISGETRRVCYSWGKGIRGADVNNGFDANIPQEIKALNCLPANSWVVEIGGAAKSAYCIVQTHILQDEKLDFLRELEIM